MTNRVVPAHDCGLHAPATPAAALPSDQAFAQAAALFRAAGDVQRLRLIARLGRREHCVSELAEAEGTKLSTLSQQLKVLRAERLVSQRREGKHIFYRLADEHVRQLVEAALAHAHEDLPTPTPSPPRRARP